MKRPVKSDFINHEVMLNVKGEFDVRYCPESVFRVYLDDDVFWRPWTDKNYYERFQPGLPLSYTYVRNVNGCFLDHDFKPIDRTQAREIVCAHLPLVVKPTILTGEGRKIKLIERPEDVDNIFTDYGKDYLLQELIVQCEEFQRLSPHSVASMRLITAVVNGEIKLLKKHLLCSTSDSIAVNSGADGGTGVVIIRIDDEGRLDNVGYREDTRRIDRRLQTVETEHAPSNAEFAGVRIPSFAEAVNIVVEAHRSMPMIDFVGWDVTIDKDNRPVVIEWNQRNLEIYHSQLTQGPLFGEYTDYFAKKVRQTHHKKLRL